MHHVSVQKLAPALCRLFQIRGVQPEAAGCASPPTCCISQVFSTARCSIKTRLLSRIQSIQSSRVRQCSPLIAFEQSKQFRTDQNIKMKGLHVLKRERTGHKICICFLFMKFRFVQPKINSCRKSLVTVFTRNRYSFQVICLNMVPYNSVSTLFSTHFANESFLPPGYPICSFSHLNHILAFLHHRLHLLIQRLQVATNLIWNGECSGNPL